MLARNRHAAHTLDASWPLFYLQGPGRHLHNRTFLREDRGDGPEVYLLARRRSAAGLAEYGSARLLFESARSRDESQGPQMRYGLYRLRLHEGLARGPAPYISPMQATGRTPGPKLEAAARPVARR